MLKLRFLPVLMLFGLVAILQSALAQVVIAPYQSEPSRTEQQ
jgi:hypothetical protein